MQKLFSLFIFTTMWLISLQMKAEEPIDSVLSIEEIEISGEADEKIQPELTGETEELFSGVKATENSLPNLFSLRTNVIPWVATIPNLGGSLSFGKHWSLGIEGWYCPWIVTSKYSLKCGFILPEIRWWPHTNRKGHFLSLHLSVGWYNLRFDDYRYQDDERPLLGAGLTYGYLLEINPHWGIEFSIGAGFVNTRYNRYYNVDNGALIDTKVSNYFGIDRLGISFVYNLSVL